jgi:autophagy-related protein 11
MADSAQDRYGEMDVMIKCLDAAVANLEISIKQIEPKYADLKKWVDPALAEHEQLAKNWEQYLSLAKNVPISALMVKFMTSRDVKRKHATLEDLIDLDTARKAGRLAPTSLRKFNTKAEDLDKAADKMYAALEGLIQEFDKLVNRSALSHGGEAAQLLQDIEAVAKKIDTDYQTSLEYTNSQRDILQASKTASNHTERLIPSLKKRAKEMDEMLQYSTQARNAIAADLIDFMRTITEITSLHSSVKTQIQVLNQAEEDMTTFDYLRLIHQLPYMYASFVSEAIRRREWSDKVKTDSSTLANEMALFQDEETKRRRRWQKMVGSTYGPDKFDANVMGLEVNLLGDEDPWPSMAKRDLEEFLVNLNHQKAEPAITDDVTKLVDELSNPTKQQSKRLKAFKNGSVHEAALGRSGLMIRGDDDLLRSLQEDKSKLESRLKTSESRVRRLEDLLHRQSQASRPNISNIFQSQSPQLHEKTDSISSIKSARPTSDRRISIDGTDVLLQRIQQLEGNLSTEKERSAIIEKDLKTRTNEHDNMKGQMEEVNSTKKDLLENMEALKREFMEERKSLEDEIKRLQARLEDTEDEMEHFGESRENEKATLDEKVQALEFDIERLNKERADEALKTQGQLDFLRTQARVQRERNEILGHELESLREERQTQTKQLSAVSEKEQTQLRFLRNTHRQLAPSEPEPGELTDLLESVGSKVMDLVARLQTMENDMSLLRTNLGLAETTTRELKDEVTAVREKCDAEKINVVHLRENLSEEKAKVTALEGQVADGQQQLVQLRTKIADGETGSETLRRKLEEEENRIVKITEELASRQSQVGGLEEELRLFKEKVDESQSKYTNITKRFDARTERAKDLTQRLYSQNDRLCRLLERLGFSVTRQGSTMTIQKIPRSERASQNLLDSTEPSSSVRRSVTLNSRTLADSADLDLLYWMNNVDPDVETEKYDAFMTALGSLDMDMYTETIYKRVKDVEYTARKLQRDAKAYREKAHSLQKEAHDKIAFRHFKEGDLALFLPTRNQTAGAWAAFNVGFPHFFLREHDSHRLQSREWLVARISRVQERVVDLSKSIKQPPDSDSVNEEEDDNPFQLSDGLRWYLIDASEDKPGAPATPGLGKSTVAANNVEAMADMHTHAQASGKNRQRANTNSIEGVSKTLSKSLESRRSSSGSKKALPFNIGGAAFLKGSALASETNSLRAAPPDSPVATSPTYGGYLTAGNIQQQQPQQPTQPQDPHEPQGQTQQQTPPRQDAEQETAESKDLAKTPEVRDVDTLVGP